MNPTFSPADSLLSTPSECYSSLFDTESSPPSESVFTPRSMLDDDSEDSSTPRITIETPAAEKKPAKKRKSWGQELPIPKTNLPPRKRAKTEDEKEQRRIERVLRNRAAAQSSRERKRLEVEGLAEAKAEVEKKFAHLEARLRDAEMQKMALREQVAQMAAQLSVFQQAGSVASSPTEATTSPTLSTDLYPSHQPDPSLHIKLEHDISFDFSLPPPPPQATVDPRDSRLSSPAASSPCLHFPNATTPNSTQYPAAVLCDLQCQLGATRPHWEGRKPTTSSASTTERQANTWPILLSMLTLTPLLFLHLSSTVSSLLHTPLTAIFTSLKTGSSLSPAELNSTLLLTLIQWLISTPVNPLTTPPNPSLSTSTTSTNPPTSTSLRRPTIRITLLHRLLACSPALALPLRDATGRALQLISRQSLARSSTSRSSFGPVLADLSTRPGVVPAGVTGATMESLMTTLWAIESFERAERARAKQEISGTTANQALGQGEQAGDIRRLCVTIDDLFSSGGSGGRVTIPLDRDTVEGKAFDDNGSESGHCDDPP